MVLSGDCIKVAMSDTESGLGDHNEIQTKVKLHISKLVWQFPSSNFNSKMDTLRDEIGARLKSWKWRRVSKIWDRLWVSEQLIARTSSVHASTTTIQELHEELQMLESHFIAQNQTKKWTGKVTTRRKNQMYSGHYWLVVVIVSIKRKNNRK